MNLIRLNKCPLCGSENISLFRKGTIDPGKINSDNFRITDSSYGSLWNFSKCRECTYVFSNPLIDEKSLIEFYSDLEDDEYSDECEGRAKNFLTIFRELEKIEIPGNLLLDIGAASGIFVNLAKERGYDAEGIEPSGYLADEAEKKFKIKLFRGTIDNFKTNKKYSVITLLDIIEHLRDASSFMKKILPLIEEKGILIIVTPDINSIPAKIFGKKWWHYRIAHLNFFNLRSIELLLKNNGFEIIKKRRYAWNFSFYYILSRLIPSLKEKKGLQKLLKRLNLKLQLFDSWEIYARKI